MIRITHTQVVIGLFTAIFIVGIGGLVVYMHDTSLTAPEIISGTVSEFAEVAKNPLASFDEHPPKDIIGVQIATTTIVRPPNTLSIDTPTPSAATTTVRAEFSVDLALTEEERVQGLSGRAGLPTDTGLLFVFDRPDFYSIWMKDMNFSIDILWIDEDLRITHIEKNVSPQTFPKTFSSEVPSRFVLELPAGTVNNSDILVGDTITFLYKE